MQQSQRQSMTWSKGRIIAVLILLVTLKVIVQTALFQDGFISVSADEFARGIRAAQWAQHPSINIINDVNDIWLPFEKYLNGSLLLLWPDAIWAPRATVLIASFLLTIVLFFLVYELFGDYTIATISGLFLIFQPWYAWLSGTPMLEMYYFLFFFLGVYLFILWVKREKTVYCYLAGLSMLVSTGFHVQSWVYINLFNLITVAYLIKIIQQKNIRKIIQLLGFYILGNLLILVFSAVEFLNTGNVFGFLASHTSYSTWFYGGYQESILQKALYYPRLIMNNLSTTAWIFFILALFFLIRDRDRKWKIYPLIFLLLALTVNSAMNIISVPATAAPGRYSVIYIILISPYLGYAWVEVLGQMRTVSAKTIKYAVIVLSSVLILHTIVWGIQKLLTYPKTISPDAMYTGTFIREKLNQYPENEVPNYMVELVYWEFLGVEITAGYFNEIVYDREYDIYNRDTQSIFLGEIEDLLSVLLAQNVKYIALYSSTTKDVANQLSYLLPIQETSHWKIFEFSVPEK